MQRREIYSARSIARKADGKKLCADFARKKDAAMQH
jgi:hypothetical protein